VAGGYESHLLLHFLVDLRSSSPRTRHITFEHFWNDFATDKTHSVPEADRKAYAAAYARPGRMRPGWAYTGLGDFARK
jgi:hypothetical protein